MSINKRCGKVCDIYDLGETILFKYSDRLSAFDKHVCDIPKKGKNLAKINKWWLEKTKHIIPNHFILQDKNYLLAKKCEPISSEEINEQKILTQEEWEFISSKALELYNFGVDIAADRDLILVDTKYEFGRYKGKIILMDEIHTCDSSRYWEIETYKEKFFKGEEPDRLDKDIIRTYLISHPNESLDLKIDEMSNAYRDFYDRLNIYEGKKLKYGCNPHQKAGIVGKNPYKTLNGEPGYINMLDAVNAWALVSEVKKSLNTICVASFKHTSPAGVAIPAGEETDEHLETTYGKTTSKVATTFLRARDVDPKSSYGDFIAISHEVDVETAKLIKGFVSDGIIAPSYEDEALEILKRKKGGKYIILKAPSVIHYNTAEFRDIGGITLYQERNDFITRPTDIIGNIPSDKVIDLVLANIVTKYTQSNSVVYTYKGRAIGIGAGQQSRIDCVKLAGEKTRIWYARQKINNIQFKDGTKRQEKINTIGDLIDNNYFLSDPILDTVDNRNICDELRKNIDNLKGLSLASDAFFPHRDNIDAAHKYGVDYIIQPGGSIVDDQIHKACNEYNIQMISTGTRLFHH